jgi:hypothetical protein
MIGSLAKTAGGVALALTLGGCVDVALEVSLTGPGTAEAVLTQVMTADFYAVSQAEPQDETVEPFCANGTLTENTDGSATCTFAEAGRFADLDLGQDAGGITFTPVGRGLVRIAMSTADLQEEVTANEDTNPEMEQMAQAFFTGRTITIRFGGATVVETNMDLSEDGASASYEMEMVDIITGDIELPDELFAVVRAP